jgi:hypothetical protein
MTEKVLILSIVSYKMQEIHITEKYMTVHFTVWRALARPHHFTKR